MRSGKSPADALRGLVVADPHGGIRQVAMVDAQGRVAAHTGADTIPEAGHELGDQFSVQANMMLRASVWPAMAKAFCAATGHLAERMLAALSRLKRRAVISAGCSPRVWCWSCRRVLSVRAAGISTPG